MSSGGGKSVSNFAGRSAFHRINFLYQASNLVSELPFSETGRILSAHYGQILSKVAKKSVLRMDPSIKRTVCKGCGSLLKPGVSSVVRKRKKNKGSVNHTCRTCGTNKSFGVREEYEIWHCKEESVHAVIVEDKSETEIVVVRNEGENVKK